MAAKTSEWRPGPSVCRCCLTEGCYKDISTEYFWMGKREVYEEMLSDTLSINIAFSQSGGPNSNSRLICEPCISRLRDATDFRRQVLECERTFMQHLDPASSSLNVEDSGSAVDADVKLEAVKQEATVSDEDFDDHCDFLEDDDDLDEVPLTKLASKVPKKESVDLLDLLDNSQVTVKRKSTTKAKASPSKKVKITKEQKPSSSKVVNVKPEKKKKEEKHEPNYIARKNAEIVVKYATVYPFRLPEKTVMCVYCAESIDNPLNYGPHMESEHGVFNYKMAFIHCHEGFIKVDCTNIRCRLCFETFDDIRTVAEHLNLKHCQTINLDGDLGMQPFKFDKDKIACAICGEKSLCLRQLSRHTQSHFLRYTCEACGKSYVTLTTLKHHIRFSHSSGERICRKCKGTFDSLEDKRKHLSNSPKCWPHLCTFCGKRFVTWTMKQVHLREVHDMRRKAYGCPECGEEFLDRRRYRIHFKISHTDDNFACSCCGVKFESKRSLEEHRVMHTKEKLFPCTVCSKSFPRKKNLTQHMWIHSEFKRFECKPCNKQFNQRVSWKTHMKSYHPELVDFETGKNNNIKLLLSVLKNS